LTEGGPRRLRANRAELPPSPASEGTRGRLLRAALGQFAEYGFAGTSIRDLGEAAGLSSAALYGFFPSKEHVLAEIVRIGHEQHLHVLRSALLDAGNDPAEQMAALVRAHVLVHARYPMLGLVANDEMHALSADMSAPALALRQQAELLTAEVVQRGVLAGRFQVDDPLLAVIAIGSMGLRVAHWFDPGQGYDAEQVADAYAEFASRILGIDRPEP